MSWKFWKHDQQTAPGQAGPEKLSKPKEIPGPVGRELVVKYGQDPDFIWNLKSVSRPQPEKKHCFDVRVFSESQAATAQIRVKDFHSLDDHPELILFEGWYNNREYIAKVAPKAAPTVKAA